MALKKRFSYQWRLFFPVVGMMWLIIAVLMVYQYRHETSYKISSMESSIDFVNNRIISAYETEIDLVPFLQFVGTYFDNTSLDPVAVSVYSKTGKLIYSIGTPTVQNFADTQDMPEFKEAEMFGIGRDKRVIGDNLVYYVAQKSDDGEVFVHTAMPYSMSLTETLSADSDFWFLLILMAVAVTVLAFYSTRFLSRNVVLLSKFVDYAETSSSKIDITKFPHDELGDISRKIINLYREKAAAISKSEKEHKVAMYAIEEKSRIKRQLTNNINHELKTPIGVIKGYIETLLSSPDMNEATRTHFLQRSLENVDRLCSLLNDVSTMTRLEDGSNNIPVTDVNFHDLVYTIDCDMESAGILGDMKFEYDIPLDCVVKGNTNLLTGMVLNLAKNAVKYSKGTEIALKLVIESKQYYTFCFYDNGTGVEAQHLPHLFERFYRIDAGRARKSGGTGLGLPIVKNTIEALGGTISVHNRSTGGLEFLFTLEKWTQSDVDES